MKALHYSLEETSNEDVDIIYKIKKNSIFEYVEPIWGWDEEYQLNDFYSSFIPDRFRKIISDRRIIGFIELHENKHSINISEIHIITQYQSRGIGTSIISNIIHEAYTNKKKVTLGCFKNNLKAKKLYEKLGFQTTEETETHYCLEK
ncbi:MAG: GNAT family N-acetyltransferase [Clostridia bacterium]|nr:GNAT family N-acetyltransferase [Clostridia bacterium]